MLFKTFYIKILSEKSQKLKKNGYVYVLLLQKYNEMKVYLLLDGITVFNRLFLKVYQVRLEMIKQLHIAGCYV